VQTEAPEAPSPQNRHERRAGRKRKRLAPVAIPHAPLTHTVAETAAMLGLGRSTIWAMITSKKLKTTKIGGARLVLHSELERLIREGEQS
jgi:excisionase family DNA binding protein